MTCPPSILQDRAASCVGDLAVTFQVIDAKRLEWLAQILEDCDRPGSAELARGWASEHRMLADRLSGAVAVGSEEAA